jgi:hypothetical protein
VTQTRLVTQVTTTVATMPDVVALPAVQQDLSAPERLPQRQLVDAGNVEATALVVSEIFKASPYFRARMNDM